MPDEKLIEELENIFSEVITLGGMRENTKIVPNMLVRDASPTGLSGFVIIADDRDNDNILAKTVPGVIYADNDLVNVIFTKGGEAIAFQQGSQSTSSGLWSIVPSTSTDIYYNGGDVGIGKAVAPDARLEILDTAQAQLRLTYQEDTKYVTFTLDANHDLTIKPTSTGQIKLQPTTDSIDFFQVLDADGGTPVLNVDSTNERVGIGTADPDAPLEILYASGAQLRLTHTDASKYTAFTVDTNHDLTIKPTSTGQIILQPTTDSVDFFQVLDADGGTPVLNVDSTNERVGIGTAAPDEILHIKSGADPIIKLQETVTADSYFDIADLTGSQARIRKVCSSGASTIDIAPIVDDGTSAASFRFFRQTNTTGDTAFYIFEGNGGAGISARISARDLDSFVCNDDDANFGIGLTAPSAKLHVDQTSTTAAIPVLYLDQADVSEEMIEFNTTIGTGNAIEAVGAKTLTTTHFIKVTIPGGLTRYIPIGTIA